MADKRREDRPPIADPEQPARSSGSESGFRLASQRTHRHLNHRRQADGDPAPVAVACLEPIGGSVSADGHDAAPGKPTPAISTSERTIRSVPAVYRWVCPCQDPPVLLATYGPNARINIKVRDRYWHLHGFGMVEAICPRCAAEHLLDLRHLHRTLDGEEAVRRSS